ncbi:hypothetical protein PIB30_072720 [Stylosanthes scabra]|uniref:Uncharacterized protein n=1 Tax=Stylosanthes scabra TaxID=79078 RepID=A0ABU6SPA6_9FABA|nr:hypothetical protein [Stylosanthes scabra]
MEGPKDAYGPWMLVQRTTRGRKGDKIGEERNEIERNVTTKGNTSKFAVLQGSDLEIIAEANHELSSRKESDDKREEAMKSIEKQPQTQPTTKTRQNPNQAYKKSFSQPAKTENYVLNPQTVNPNPNILHHQDNWVVPIFPSPITSMETLESPPENEMIEDHLDPKPPDVSSPAPTGLVIEDIPFEKKMECEDVEVVEKTPLQGDQMQCN